VARRYQAIVELAPDATVVVDSGGRIVLVNHQTEVLFDYSRERLLGQPVERLIPARFHTAHQQHRTDYAAAPRTRPMGANLHLVGRRRDGREFPVEVNLAPFDEEGTPLVIASIRDVSEAQRVQAANRELRRLDALTDTALAHLELDALLPTLLLRVRDVLEADHVTILLLDADGQTLVVRAELHPPQDEPAWPRMPVGVGFAGRIAASRAPLVVEDLAHFPLVRPQLRQTLRSAVGVPLLAGEQLLGVLCVGAAQVRHFAAQDVALLERAAERISTAIERAQLFAAEQTARREAERQAIRWQAAMESTPEFIITCDADLRITYVNPAAEGLRGGAADSAVPVEERPARYGLNLPNGTDLFPVEQLPLTRAMREGRSVHGVEMVVRNQEGEERLVAWAAAPMHTAQGELLGAVGIGHDITERRRLEQEREAARVEAERQTAQLEATFEAMADGVTVYNAAGQLVRANAAQRRLLGLDAAPPGYAALPLSERIALFAVRDAQGRPLTVDGGPLVRALRGEVLSGTETLDIRLRTLDGRELEVSARVAPMRNPDGQVEGAVLLLYERTEHNRLERERQEALRRSEEWFRSMADTAPVLLWVADTNGLVTFLNAPWLTFTGRNLEQELGNGWAEGVHPDDYEHCLQTYHTAFHAREPFTMEYRLRRFDGEYRWLVDTGVPRFAAGGAFAGYIGSAIDITDRRRLEQERAEQASQLETIFDSLADPLFVFNAAGQLLRANPSARQLLYADQRDATVPLAERPSRYQVRDENGRPLPREEWPITHLLRGETLSGVGAQDVRVRLPDGRDALLSYTGGPIHGAQGQLIGIVAIARDLTERRRLEQERKEAQARELALWEVNQRLDTFVDVAAHDLRQPVAVSKMGVQASQRQVRQAAASLRRASNKQTLAFVQVEQALEIAERSLDHLWRQMQQLLDVRRAREGTLALDRQPCDLAALVRREVQEQRLLTPGRTLTLDLPNAADGQPVVVEADADRVSQVVANYLSNAVRYSSDDQPIAVTLRLEGDRARVEVRDQGPGIPPEEQGAIWDRFQRASSVGAAGGGLGLGLYISRTLMELHSGQLGVESIVGEGSTFWFSLPLAAGAGGGAAPPPPDTAP
jgi:PAS domain S-box-containing protein